MVGARESRQRPEAGTPGGGVRGGGPRRRGGGGGGGEGGGGGTEEKAEPSHGVRNNLTILAITQLIRKAATFICKTTKFMSNTVEFFVKNTNRDVNLQFPLLVFSDFEI